MAVLSEADRVKVWADWMRANADACAITKFDLRAAIDAADAWADANAASYNSALPQPARGALTAKQKARLLAYIINRRFELS